MMRRMASLLVPARHQPSTAALKPDATPAPHNLGDQITLFPARAFLAFGWLRAGLEKLIEPDWWSGLSLQAFLHDHEASMLPFMTALVDTLVRPTLIATSALVVIVELVLGVCLLTGRRLIPALLCASAFNVVFVLLGAVTPSAFYLVLQLTLLLACLAKRGRVRRLTRAAVVAAASAIAIALVPFVETLHPAEVIEDPAIMLITVATLVACTQLLHLAAEHLRAMSPSRGLSPPRGLSSAG